MLDIEVQEGGHTVLVADISCFLGSLLILTSATPSHASLQLDSAHTARNEHLKKCSWGMLGQQPWCLLMQAGGVRRAKVSANFAVASTIILIC